MKDSGRVSDPARRRREITYIARLFNIVFLDSLLSDSIHEDSLKAFENDVLAVSWNYDERICLMATSVVIHSWDFQDDPAIEYYRHYRFDWGDIGWADARGAFVGLCTGNPLGAAVGAEVGSVYSVVKQVYDQREW